MFHNFGYGMGGWGILYMFLFWAGLILLGAWLLRSLMAASRDGASGSGNARQIADRRYAKGEIDREEYEQIKRDLES